MPYILFEELPDTCCKGTLRRFRIAKNRLKKIVARGPENFWPILYQSLRVPQIDKVGSKQLPRIRDIMEFALFQVFRLQGFAGKEPLFGFINSDIYITGKGVEVLEKLDDSDVDIALLSRHDVPEQALQKLGDKTLPMCYRAAPVNHAISCDGWLMRRKAWERLREYYPKQMLIGEPWWDTCAIALSLHFKDEFNVQHFCDGEFLHPKHWGTWEDLSLEAIRARDAHLHLKALMKIGEVR